MRSGGEAGMNVRIDRRCLRRLALFASLLSMVGCSTVGGWFGGAAPKVKPAELPVFQETVRLSRLWDVNIGTGQPYALSPASDGQAIYAVNREGRIVKIDAASGRELGRIETGKRLSGGVGVGAGLVLVGTPKGELLAYRMADGQPAWTAQLSGEILTPPIVQGEMVIARGNDGKVWALDVADGRRRWVYSRPLPALTLREPSGLVADARAVYAGFPGGRLVALSLANGAPLWEANVALPRGATDLERIADVTGALALNERQICAAAYQGRVACFDRLSGQNVWSREFSALRGVAGDARQIYTVDVNDAVQSFDRERGVSPWKQDKLRDRRLNSPLPLGRYVAVGDYQGYVHLLDAETGAFAARIATDGSAIVAPMLAIGQGLVVQTANGGVFAFAIAER